MAAYRRVYDSCHLHADVKNRDQLRNPTLGIRAWATFLWGDSDVISFYIYASWGFRLHVAGKTLINVC